MSITAKQIIGQLRPPCVEVSETFQVRRPYINKNGEEDTRIDNVGSLAAWRWKRQHLTRFTRLFCRTKGHWAWTHNGNDERHYQWCATLRGGLPYKRDWLEVKDSRFTNPELGSWPAAFKPGDLRGHLLNEDIRAVQVANFPLAVAMDSDAHHPEKAGEEWAAIEDQLRALLTVRMPLFLERTPGGVHTRFRFEREADPTKWTEASVIRDLLIELFDNQRVEILPEIRLATEEKTRLPLGIERRVLLVQDRQVTFGPLDLVNPGMSLQAFQAIEELPPISLKQLQHMAALRRRGRKKAPVVLASTAPPPNSERERNPETSSGDSIACQKAPSREHPKKRQRLDLEGLDMHEQLTEKEQRFLDGLLDKFPPPETHRTNGTMSVAWECRKTNYPLDRAVAITWAWVQHYGDRSRTLAAHPKSAFKETARSVHKVYTADVKKEFTGRKPVPDRDQVRLLKWLGCSSKEAKAIASVMKLWNHQGKQIGQIVDLAGNALALFGGWPKDAWRALARCKRKIASLKIAERVQRGSPGCHADRFRILKLAIEKPDGLLRFPDGKAITTPNHAQVVCDSRAATAA